MDFPATWDIFPVADFTSASTRNEGELGMELLAQARPNGRVLDHHRVSLGGSRILDAQFFMSKLGLTPLATP